MPSLGEFIKEKREAAGLSQKLLGNISGVSDTAIHNVEIGKTKNPGWDLLCRIAVALKFHPFEILKIAGYITDEDINPICLVKGLEMLDSCERKKVQLFIDFLLTLKKNDDSQQEGCNRVI